MNCHHPQVLTHPGELLSAAITYRKIDDTTTPPNTVPVSRKRLICKELSRWATHLVTYVGKFGIAGAQG